MRDASLAVLREIGVETGGSNVQFAVNPAERQDDRHRNEPARLALLRAGVESDGLSDREGRGETCRRLHARRDRQRHYGGRDTRFLRANDRLRRHKNPALRLREIPGRRADPDDGDEVSGRGDGDRPHIPREPAEGVALAGDRALSGLDEIEIEGQGSDERDDGNNALRAALGTPDAGPVAHWSDRRCGSACPEAEIHEICRIDPWFIDAVRKTSSRLEAQGSPPWPAGAMPAICAALKAMGFSDTRLSTLWPAH